MRNSRQESDETSNTEEKWNSSQLSQFLCSIFCFSTRLRQKSEANFTTITEKNCKHDLKVGVHKCFFATAPEKSY